MYGGTPYGGVRKSSSASSALLDSFLDGSATTGAYVNDRITKVAPYAFAYTQFTSIFLPNVETAGNSAFYQCNMLASVNMPNLVVANVSTFRECASLTSVSLSNLKITGAVAFGYCTSLTAISLPSLEEMSGSTFRGCTSLTSISLPALRTTSFSEFSDCNSLVSISLPNLTYSDSSLFQSCTALSHIILPNLLTLVSYMFYDCTSLSIIDLSKASSFKNNAYGVFYNTNSNLKLILRNNSVCAFGTGTLANIFANSAFASAGAGGTLYVPQSLVSAYQNDAQWKQVLAFNANNKILPIEGSPYENS